MKCRGDPEQCFFFIPRQESEARGGRPSRLTETGYWKATGSPSYVYSSNNRVIGLKRTMVFYVGRAPQGEKTQWKMNEYKAIQLGGDQASSSTSATTTPTVYLIKYLCIYRKKRINYYRVLLILIILTVIIFIMIIKEPYFFTLFMFVF